jgi:hypothetical protein
MQITSRLLPIAALLTVCASAAYGQPTPDASGHWQGAIQAPDRIVDIEIDLATEGTGQLVGAFTQLGNNIRGLPLAAVTQDGRSLKLVLRAGTGGGVFTGKLSADGKTIDGDFVTDEGGYTVPFSIKHTGPARLPPAPKNAAIAKEFEGQWSGAIELGERRMRVSLTLANETDGSSVGTIASPDGGHLSLPVAITQQGSSLTLEVVSVGARFTGTLNAAGTEIAGEWEQGGGSLPLTLRR